MYFEFLLPIHSDLIVCKLNGISKMSQHIQSLYQLMHKQTSKMKNANFSIQMLFIDLYAHSSVSN